MSLDLNATGPKIVAGSGGGTSAADPLVQTVRISGNVPVIEPNLEAATGSPGDGVWAGSGAASIIAALKSIAQRFGVGMAPVDASQTIPSL